LLKEELDRNAKRGLANYFARTYYTRLEKRFSQWKQTVLNSKHRELLCRKLIDQWRTHRFYFVKATF